MKTARKIVCMLLAVCLMFGLLLTSGGTIRAHADGEDVPSLPLTIDFEDDAVGTYPNGFHVQADTLKVLPEAEQRFTVIDEGNGNKMAQMIMIPMDQQTNYYAVYSFEPTDSILMKYRFKLSGKSNGSYIPFPMYTGIDNKNAYNSAPLLPFVVDNGQGYYNLYYGYSDDLNALCAEGLYADQWYEIVMLVDLKSDTRKMYLDGKQLDLSSPKSVDRYTDKSEMSMDRIGIGGYFAVSGQYFVDDIEILASAKATELAFEQKDFNVRVNSSEKAVFDYLPLGADPCDVTFTSNDPSIATVDENGLITGVKEGKTTISVTSSEEAVAPVTLNVTVDKEMTGSFSNVPDTLKVPLRGHLTLAPEMKLDYEGDNTIEIVPEDPSILSMDEYGELYALAEGETTLLVRAKKYPTVVKEIPVTVKKADVQQTIYVAPNGTGDGSSDSNPTNLDNVLSILEGINNSTMTGNVEVILADGYYYRSEALVLNEKHGGNNLYSVVFKAAEGAEPTIGGAMHIAGSDFKESDMEGVYVVDVPAGTYTRQLYVDNVRAVRAKEDGLPINVAIYENEFGQNMGLLCENTELLGIENADEVEIVWYNCWAHQRAGVAEIKKGADGKVQLIMDRTVWNWAFGTAPSSDFKIEQISQIENALVYLDEPGEWYLDKTANKLYYMPREFEDISKVTVTVPTLDVWCSERQNDRYAFDESLGLVTVIGSDMDNFAQNIQFEGITFADTTWTRPSSEYGHLCNEANYIRDRDLDDKIDEVADAAVNVRRANGVSFYDCVFTRIGSTGVWMNVGVKNCMVVGSHLYNIDGTGIQVGEVDYLTDANIFAPTDERYVMKNCDILNNYIHDIGVDYHSAAAISVGFAADIDVSHNEIFNIPFDGIHFGYGWNNGTQKNIKNTNVSYNFVHELMIHDTNDGGAFYTCSNTAGNNKIFNNYFRNQGSDVAAIYFDSGAGYWDIISNVVDVTEISVDAVTGRGIDWSYSAATGHHLNYYDNFYADADEPYFGINSSNTIKENNTRVYNNEWPEEALKIMEEAGLEDAYTGLRNNQIERLYTNLTMFMITPRVTSYRKLKLDTDDAEKKTYQVEVTATDGKDQPLDITGCVKYYVEDESVAYVDENGLVTALKAGETTLRVYVNSNNILTTMESQVVVTGETVETLPTTEATEPTGTDVENPAPQNPVMWIVIGIVAVAAVVIVVILLPKKKADK